MKKESSKSLTIGAISVVLLMAWQMRTRPAGTVSLPEDLEPVQKMQRQPSSQPKNPETPKPKSVTDREALLQAIRETKECYATEKCDYPHTDPKSYEIAVGQTLKGLLNDYRTKYGVDPKNSGEMQILALEFINSDDEYVQEQALNMFSALPPSSENLQAIVQAMGDTTDPLLVDQAMNEMKRYMGTSEEATVHAYLRDLLGQGSVFSSETAAKKILSFINSQSYPGYEGLVRGMPSNSTTAQSLRTALDEYRRLQTGG